MNFMYIVSKLIKKSNFPAIKCSDIHKTSRICSGTQLVKVEIDKYSYVGNYCTVINAKIGSFCSIADNCSIGGSSHPTAWVSTSPVFYEGRNILKKNFASHKYDTSITTFIGHDVWIGTNSLIKGGVKIENGAIIGMGSVLTKDVGPYEIWAGNPAKLIRKRFSNEIVEQINSSGWWTWDDDKLMTKSLLFNNVQEFVERESL